jgi:hypothetical protein
MTDQGDRASHGIVNLDEQTGRERRTSKLDVTWTLLEYGLAVLLDVHAAGAKL